MSARRDHGREKWSADEDAVLREVYPNEGAAGVGRRLPHRTRRMIYSRAYKLRLKGKGGANRTPFVVPPGFDEAVRDAYASRTVSDAIAAVVDRFGVPRWRVRVRARDLGCSKRQPDKRPWSGEESAIVREHRAKSAEMIRWHLREAGFHRAISQIHVLRRERLDGPYDPSILRITEIVASMGVSMSCVHGWITEQGLPAIRSGAAARSARVVRRDDFRTFVLRRADLIDLRLVDQVWFMELMSEVRASPGEVEAAREEGRREGRVALRRAHAERDAALEAARQARAPREVRMPLSLGLTALEAKFLAVLYRGKRVSKGALYNELYWLEDDGPDLKIIDVLATKVRGKLAGHSIRIRTIWGEGYVIEKPSLDRLQALLEAEDVAA